jgi:transposase-like protein
MMKYKKSYKIECAKKYLAGESVEQPEYSKATKRRFRKMIAEWAKIYQKKGEKGFQVTRKPWTAKERYRLVLRAMKGETVRGVALEGGVSARQLWKWIKIFKENGYEGLEYQKEKQPKGAKEKMNKTEETEKLTKSEKKELKELRRQNEYLRAENAYLKKLRALIAEKEAEESIKAKKQQSSTNSAEKDTK